MASSQFHSSGYLSRYPEGSFFLDSVFPEEETETPINRGLEHFLIEEEKKAAKNVTLNLKIRIKHLKMLLKEFYGSKITLDFLKKESERYYYNFILIPKNIKNIFDQDPINKDLEKELLTIVDFIKHYK